MNDSQDDAVVDVAAYSPLLEQLRDGCVLLDDSLRIRFLNAVARSDMARGGVDPASLLGAELWTLAPYEPDSRERVAVETARRERSSNHMSTRGPMSGVWVESELVPVPGGMVLYYRDITAYVQAERARVAVESELRETAQRLRVVIREAPLAVILVDRDLRIQHWNPAAEAIFQWTEEEVRGGLLPYVPEEETERFRESVSEALAGSHLRARPARRRRKDGVVLDVLLSTATLLDDSGNPIGLIGMVADISDQRRLEARVRMGQKMEAVGQLAGGVAHDFNNLLTAIKGFTALLQLSVPSDPQSSEFLEEIDKAADRAAGLTAQLLAFSRRQLLRPEALDLNARIRDVERMLRLLLASAGTLTLELAPGLDRVLVDPGQIEQVLLNLVVNARDALNGRPDGHVVIATRNVQLRDEFMHWGTEPVPGDYVCLDVRDNGMGMDRAVQQRIFEPFFTTKPTGQGNGLGLATVFGIVKQSAGYVWVSSTPGDGATFSVFLPRADHPGDEGETAEQSSSPGAKRVLLVEDEHAVRRVARRALELNGYQVIDVASGEEAIEVAAREHFDVLVTDVMMPGMLGTAVAEQLRATRPDLPVLFMSGHAQDVVRRGLMDPGTPFLSKPFSPSQLANGVRDAIAHMRNMGSRGGPTLL